MSRISVIVPVYKVEPYLRRCVDSVLGQTFADFELVLVDDGSPDNCGAICDEYAKQDHRVHVIHRENGGLSAARNAGIDWVFANSDSQWISFVDSDDWVHPQYLEHLMAATDEGTYDISACGFQKTDAEGDIKPFLRNVCDVMPTSVFFTSQHADAIPACGKLYRKGLFMDIRYPVGKLHEDEFTTHKLLFQADKIAVIFDPLYFYFYNGEGITKSVWTPKRLDALVACEERARFFLDQKNMELTKYTLGIYLSYIDLAKTKIAACSNQARVSEYNALLRRHVRDMLRRWRGFHISDMVGIYEFAYPKAIKCYWIAQGIRNRLKRFFTR